MIVDAGKDIHNLSDLEAFLVSPPPFILHFSSLEEWRWNVFNWLFYPGTSGFLTLCKEAVAQGRMDVLNNWKNRTLEWYRVFWNSHIDQRFFTRVQSMLTCACSACLLKGSADTSRYDFTEIEQELHTSRAGTSLLTISGFLKHLFFFFLNNGNQQVEKVIKIPVLLVKKDSSGMESGFIAYLVLSLIPGGDNMFITSPSMTFVELDTLFISALDNAWLSADGKIPRGYDVQWSLFRATENKIGLFLCGDSLGAAVSMGLHQLAGEEILLYPGVSVTSGITPSGRLHPVDGLPYKLNAALYQEVFPPIHTVVLAHNQHLSDEEIESEIHNQYIFKMKHRDFYFIKGKDVNQVSTLLALNESRWQTCSCSLLFRDTLKPDFQGRDDLFTYIHHYIQSRDKGTLLLLGGMGKGKSSFLAQVIYHARLKGKRPVFHFIGYTASFSGSGEEIISCIYRKLQQKYVFAGPEKLLGGEELSGELEKLLVHISRRNRSRGEKEIIYIDALDHISGVDTREHHIDKGLFRILQHPLPGIFFVITSRHIPWWCNETEDVTISHMDDYTDDRKDVRDYLVKQGDGKSTFLSREMIDRITSSTLPPVFFSICQCVHILERNGIHQKLFDSVQPWLTPADKLIKEEIDRIILQCEELHIPSHSVCTILGVLVVSFEPLNEMQLRALGLWVDGETDIILRISTNLFKASSTPHTEEPYQFDHPGYCDELLKHIKQYMTECHELLAKGCAHIWEDTGTSTGSYGLSYRIPHLRAARMWKEILTVLGEPVFFIEYSRVCGVVQLYKEVSMIFTNNGLAKKYYIAFAVYEQFLRDRLDYFMKYPWMYGQELLNELIPRAPGIIRESWKDIEDYFSFYGEYYAVKISGPPCIVKKGHQAGITGIAFSPDSTLLLSVSNDASIKLWETESGRLIADCRYTTDSPLSSGGSRKKRVVKSFSMALDGTIVAAGYDDGTVTVLDAKTGIVLYRIQDHNASIPIIAFSPDNETFATGSDDNTIKIRHRNGQTIKTLCATHVGSMNCLVYSPDSSVIASAGDDGIICIWETATGMLLREYTGHEKAITTLVFSPDNMVLASAGWDGVIRLWEISGKVCVALLQGHTDIITQICFSPDSHFLVSTGWDCTIKIWDAAGKKKTADITAHREIINVIAISSDGTRIVSGSDDTEVKVWDMATGSLLSRWTGHKECVTSVAFYPGGEIVASGSDDGAIHLWEIKEEKAVLLLMDTLPVMEFLACSHDGKLTASIVNDTEVIIREPVKGIEMCCYSDHYSYITCAAFSMDRKLIATGSRDQTIRVWEPDTGMPVSLYSGFMERITCCTFLPGKPLLIAGYNNGLITFVDAVTGKSLSTWRVLDTPVTTLACSADGRIIAAGYESGVITIWSGEGSSLRFSRSGHRGAVHALSFSPDGGALFSGGEDHVLRVWDTATGIPGREYPGHTAPVRACAVSPDNSFVVSGSDDATAVIWGREENIALSVLYYSFALTHVQWIPGTPPVLVVIDCKGRTFHYQSGLENICYNIDNFMVNYNDKQAERDNP